MIQNVQVAFTKAGRLYTYGWEGKERLKRGDRVLVPGINGLSWGDVVRTTSDYDGDYLNYVVTAVRGGTDIK